MDSHSTDKEPPRQNNPRLYHFLGGIIAVLTLVLPLYITSHYSSFSALTRPSASNTNSPP